MWNSVSTNAFAKLMSLCFTLCLWIRVLNFRSICSLGMRSNRWRTENLDVYNMIGIENYGICRRLIPREFKNGEISLYLTCLKTSKSLKRNILRVFFPLNIGQFGVRLIWQSYWLKCNTYQGTGLITALRALYLQLIVLDLISTCLQFSIMW